MGDTLTPGFGRRSTEYPLLRCLFQSAIRAGFSAKKCLSRICGAELVTRKDLDLAKGALELAIERLRGELQRFILVSVVLVAIAQILVLKIWQ